MIDSIPSFWKLSGWIALMWLGMIVVTVVSVYVIIAVPSDSDRVVVIGTCGGLPILQRSDGSTWLRVNGLRTYKVEDPSKLTCG